MLATASSEVEIIAISAFVAAAETGSLSHAALRIGCSQSVVSRRVQSLETMLSGKLFSRTGRGVHLTELGAALLPRAQALLENVSQFMEVANSTREQPEGTVRLTLPRWTAGGPVYRLVNYINEHYPKIRLIIYETFSRDTLDRLADGRLDIGVFHSHLPEVPQHAELLFSSDLMLVGKAGSQLVAQPTVPITALDGVKIVSLPMPNPVQILLTDALKRHPVSIEIDLEVNSGVLIREIVRHSDRYALTVIHTLKEELEKGDLRASRIVDPYLRLYTFCGTGPKHMTTQASRIVERCVISLLRDYHESVCGMLQLKE